MIEPAAEATRRWATDLDARFCGPSNALAIRAIYDGQRSAPGMNHAMAQLDYDLFVTALVHYRSNGDIRQKCHEVANLSAVGLSRRNYYDKLDRVHYFVAGYLAAQSHARA
jgi:hypothetical protein